MANKGHEFQGQQSQFLRPDMVRRVPRDLPSKAISTYLGGIAEDANEELMRALRRQANFSQLIISYTAEPLLVLPATIRTYVLIQNIDSLETLYVGFGFEPSNGIGLLLAADGGFYEPFQVPQNDIWVVGSGAGTVNIIYANG